MAPAAIREARSPAAAAEQAPDRIAPAGPPRARARCPDHRPCLWQSQTKRLAGAGRHAPEPGPHRRTRRSGARSWPPAGRARAACRRRTSCWRPQPHAVWPMPNQGIRIQRPHQRGSARAVRAAGSPTSSMTPVFAARVSGARRRHRYRTADARQVQFPRTTLARSATVVAGTTSTRRQRPRARAGQQPAADLRAAFSIRAAPARPLRRTGQLPGPPSARSAASTVGGTGAGP